MIYDDAKRVGIVEVLAPRTYALDPQVQNPSVEAVVPPGEYPLYESHGSYFWMMEGSLNAGGMQTLGDGMFAIVPGDLESEITVRFPSRTFGPEAWTDLLAHPVCTEGAPEQRLRISMEVLAQ